MNSIVHIDGSTIKRLREEQQLTQLYIATAVEVTVDTISRWENKRYPGIKKENGLKLARALGVELEDITQQKDDETIPEQQETSQGIFPERNRLARYLPWLIVACVVILGTAAGVYFRGMGNTMSSLQAVRLLPEHTAPGQPFPVVVMVSGAEGTSAPVLIREHITGDCVANEPGPDGKEFGTSPKWVGRLENGSAFFSYVVHPAPGITPEKEIIFRGEVVLEADQQERLQIQGPERVRITLYHWADLDKDSVISDTEILKVYETWAFDGSGFDLDVVEELWQAGSYQWNEADPGTWRIREQTTDKME